MEHVEREDIITSTTFAVMLGQFKGNDRVVSKYYIDG
jgi:hypothetical protein